MTPTMPTPGHATSPAPVRINPQYMDPELSNPSIGIGFWLLCLFVFLALGRATDFFLAGLHVPLLISCVTLVFGLMSGRIFSALYEKSSLMLALFTGCMVLSVPFSVWRGGSVEILTNWLKSFVCFLLIIALVSNVKRAITMIHVIGFAMVCVALLAIRFPSQMEGRLILQQGMYSGPNEIATAAILGIIVWWYILTRPKSNMMKRVAALGLLLFVGALLPKTGSRGGIIVLAVVSIPIFMRLNMAQRLTTAVATVLIAVFTFSLLPEHLRARYLSYATASDAEFDSKDARMQALTAEASSKERWNVLVASLWVTLRYPILGVGPGNFGVVRSAGQVSEGQRGSYQGTHNTYTQISSEVGLPALGLFLASLFYAWQGVRRVEKAFRNSKELQAREICAAAFCLRMLLLSYMIGFFFEHIGYDPFYLLVAALCTAFSSAAMREYQQVTAMAGTTGGVAAAALTMGPNGPLRPSLPGMAHPGPTRQPAMIAHDAPQPISSAGYRFGGVRLAQRPQ